MLSLNDRLFSSIAILLNPSRPLDVSGFVISIAIYAIYCVCFAGWLSDVLVKSLKVVLPFMANFNTPASVIGKIRVGLAATSFFHALPRSENFCPGHSMNCMSFGKMGLGTIKKASTVFFSKTSTRSRMSASEIAYVNPARITTFTNAKPITLFTVGRCVSGLELIRNS